MDVEGRCGIQLWFGMQIIWLPPTTPVAGCWCRREMCKAVRRKRSDANHSYGDSNADPSPS